MKLIIDLDTTDVDYDSTVVSTILADAIKGSVQAAVRKEVATHTKTIESLVREAVRVTLAPEHKKDVVRGVLESMLAKVNA